MSAPNTPDIDIYFDDQLLAQIILDPIQDAFPWYTGTLIEGPAMPRWRDLVRAYHAAGLEFDYAPHHPDERPFEETDLAAYIADLVKLRAARAAGDQVTGEDDDLLGSWQQAPIERLDEYISFLDWRRWRATNRAGQIIAGIPLPPSLDLASKRFNFRP